MRVTTEGLEELNSYEPSPEPYFNENVGAWDDQLGHFSYDGGATWGAARSYAAAPAPVSTAGAMESLGNTYSLSGPAFDDFNIGTLTPEPDIPVWDEATQGYRDKWGNYSYDGGVTWGSPRYYAPPPVSTAGALAQLPEGPTDRASFIDYEGANAGNPFDAPGFESPWMPPAMQDNGDGGGLWGGFKNALGNIAEVGTVPYQLANEVADRLTGSTEQERWESNVSGNQFADLVTGGRADLEDLPYGLGYATDAALAPATWLTAGVGPSVPVLGSTFSGNVGKRLAGEIAVGAAGIKGSEMGAEYAPEVIPNFSVPNIDAEILGRDVLLGDEALNFLGSDAGQSVAGGIAGGLLGGVGAYGGLKGLDAALNLGAVDEAIPSIYKASPFRVGDEAQFPAFAKDITVPPGRAIPQVAGAADDALPPIDFTGAKPKRIATFDWDFPSGLKNGDVVDTPYGKLDVRSVRMGDEGIGTVYGKFVQTNSKLGVSKTDEVMIRNRAPDPAALAANRAKAEAWNAAMKTPDGPALGNAGWKPIVEGGDVKAWDFNGVQIARQADGEWAITVDGATFRASSPKAALDKELAAQAERMASNQAKGLPRYSGKLVNPDDALPPKPPIASADTALNEPRRKLLDALDEQRRFRESGQADEIIHAGRVQQAKGIAAATENLGDTFAESLDAMSAGARVGKMLPAGQPLDIDDGTALSLLREAIEFNGGKQFDNYRAGKALNKLLKGEKLQPGEIKMLGQIYGDEVARAIRETNAGRIATVAELTPDDIVKINEQARVDGKRAAVLEAQARRQHELADDLQRQARMDPTNKRLAKAVDDARARAIAKENEADRVLAERAKILERKQLEKAEQARIKEAQAGTKAALSEEEAAKQAFEAEWARDLTSPLDDPFGEMVARRETREMDWLGRQQDRLKADNWEKTQSEWAQGLDDPAADDYARRLARLEDSDTATLGRQQDQAWRSQVLASVRDNGQEALAKAQAIIDESDVSPALKAQQTKALEAQLKIDGAVLDGMGEDAPGVIRQMYAAAVGEVTDSFTSKLLMEQAFFKTAMMETGMSADDAKRMAKLLQEIELKRRFGGDIPKHVRDSLDMAKSQRGMDATAARAAGDISQTLKNTTLGLGDAAVFGQQGAKLTLTDTPQILTGAVNRLLNKVHAGIDTGFQVNNLPRRAQKALDGISLSSQGITDLSQEGTLISLIPKVGKKLDVPIIRLTQFLTDLQFKHVLGSLRDLAFEGNLVLAKIAGDDVTDPIVRQTAADWANVSSGAAKLAQRSTRREVEKAALLSPGLTRAQIQKPGQIVRGLGLFAQDAAWLTTFGKVSRNLDAGTRFTRVAAATSVASTAVVTLALGKALNDYVGLEPFKFDPSDPEFGNITLPGGTVINVFPQEQVAKTVARSFRILAEDGVSQADVAPLLTEWGKLAIGRSSPAARIGLGFLDTGYQPGAGYKFGDMDMSIKDKVLSTVAPPIAQSLLREGWDSVRTPLEFFGVNAYPESEYDALDRAVRNDPAFGGKSYRELTDPLLKQQAQEKYGKLEPFGPEGERAAEVLVEKTGQQSALDARLKLGEVSFEQWHERTEEIKDELRITNEEIYAELRKSGKLETKDPILKPYFAVMASAERPDGTFDWDKVDKYRATLSDADNDYINTRTGLLKIRTDQTEKAAKYADVIEETGYWKVPDKIFAKWVAAKGHEAEAAGKTPDQFFQEARLAVYQRLLEEGNDEYKANVLTEIAIDKYRSSFDELAGEIRKRMREASPELMRALVESGYYQPGVEAAREMFKP
jgi:hypothetical protein